MEAVVARMTKVALHVGRGSPLTWNFDWIPWTGTEKTTKFHSFLRLFVSHSQIFQKICQIEGGS